MQQPTKLLANIGHQRRRILFPHERSGQQIWKVDIILLLNETLQTAREGIDTQFSRVTYAPSEAINALLIKKANAGLLISRLCNLLIWAIKTVDSTVVEVEILEHWQRLKVHGMSLQRYLRRKDGADETKSSINRDTIEDTPTLVDIWKSSPRTIREPK